LFEGNPKLLIPTGKRGGQEERIRERFVVGKMSARREEKESLEKRSDAHEKKKRRGGSFIFIAE